MVLLRQRNGEEDFLSERGWEIMLELLEEYDVLIFGRKTWDNIISWDKKYLQDLENTNVIILSSTNENSNKFSFVTYCNSIDDCLHTCKKLGYERIFISGGAMINNSFMERGIVDYNLK